MERCSTSVLIPRCTGLHLWHLLSICSTQLWWCLNAGLLYVLPFLLVDWGGRLQSVNGTDETQAWQGEATGLRGETVSTIWGPFLRNRGRIMEKKTQNQQLWMNLDESGLCLRQETPRRVVFLAGNGWRLGRMEFQSTWWKLWLMILLYETSAIGLPDLVKNSTWDHPLTYRHWHTCRIYATVSSCGSCGKQVTVLLASAQATLLKGAKVWSLRRSDAFRGQKRHWKLLWGFIRIVIDSLMGKHVFSLKCKNCITMQIHSL